MVNQLFLVKNKNIYKLENKNKQHKFERRKHTL